jgi:hypothetical protein
MFKPAIAAIAAAVTLAFGAGAFAAEMSKDDYNAGKARLSAQYKSARAGCDAYAGNARQVCVADAKGKEDVDRAELEAAYKPGNKARYNVRVAKADAAHSVARQKCDDKAGNVKDVCLKEAKAAEVAAKADAKALLTAEDANEKAAETSAKANRQASEKGVDARRDAASNKRDADYAVALEKCDSFSGDAKTACVRDARARFGRS